MNIPERKSNITATHLKLMLMLYWLIPMAAGVGVVWLYNREKLLEGMSLAAMAAMAMFYIVLDCDAAKVFKIDSDRALQEKTVWRPETNSYHL